MRSTVPSGDAFEGFANPKAAIGRGSTNRERGPGALGSWRATRAARRRSRLVSRRNRRALAQTMRRVCKAAATESSASRWLVLLCSRAAPLRSELLEVAALLERTEDPDWRCVAALRDLLHDGATSPLYNPAVEAQKLPRILDYARASLGAGEDAL